MTENPLPGTRRVSAVLLAVALAAVPLRGGATDYFVDALDGNDANAGTSRAAAWQTLGMANQTVAPGDTVHVLEGTYDQQEIAPARAGEQDARITYLARGRVILTRGESRLRSFVTVDGFEIRDGPTVGIAVVDATDIVVRRTRILNHPFDGVVFIGPNTTVLIERSVIAGNRNGINGDVAALRINHSTIADNRSHGVFLSRGGNRIESSIVYRNAGFGLNGEVVSAFNDVVGNGTDYHPSVDPSSTDVSVDPQLIDPVAGNYLLEPTSPLFNAGADGLTIGAHGVGFTSAFATDGWAGWTDASGRGIGDPLAEIVQDAGGNLRIRDDLVSAAVRSPVIEVQQAGGTISGVDFEGLAVAGSLAGSRQVIDFDATTRESEIRYRSSLSAFGPTSTSPPWRVTVRGDPIEATGGFLQVEYTLRRDGE